MLCIITNYYYKMWENICDMMTVCTEYLSTNYVPFYYAYCKPFIPPTNKIAIARQPGLVPAAEICIELTPEFTADSVRGLEDFDYVWISFIFHGVLDEGWAQMVRPPRLEANKKMGVFATRSPHRPNHLGLSPAETQTHRNRQTCPHLLQRRRPIRRYSVVDIKPYIPFIESKPDASSGFVSGKPEELNVVWAESTLAEHLSTEEKHLIEQSIAQDPRPVYQDIPERIYVMNIADYEVQFRIENKCATVIKLSTI